jgi:hypothetical protein
MYGLLLGAAKFARHVSELSECDIREISVSANASVMHTDLCDQ